MNKSTLDAFARLADTFDIVREKCPWDRKQTMESLRYLTIEETYELSEAILSLSQAQGKEERAYASTEMKKELGDIFMHLLFYAKIATEQGLFTADDVFDAITNKLIHRHPFIFNKDEYHGESWEQLKMHEGRKSVLEGVPSSLPPLVKAVRLQEKAAGIGFEISGTPIPLQDEMDETQFGDMLFQLIHWAHERGINADSALSSANVRFQKTVREFESVETE